MSADDLLAVVADTSVLVNFLVLDRIDLLVEHPRYQFFLPEEVRREVTAPEERERLERCLAEGGLTTLSLATMDELAHFARLDRVVGRGEAAAIAAAAHHGYILALDEKGRARREARQRVGETKLVNTPGILLASIRSGRITIAQADDVKRELEVHRFRMSFASFTDLVPEKESRSYPSETR
jgi:predicted nucleic acid-binding protein